MTDVTRWIIDTDKTAHGIRLNMNSQQVTVCETPIPVIAPNDPNWDKKSWKWTAFGAPRPKRPKFCEECKRRLVGKRQSRPVQSGEHEGSNPSEPTTPSHTFIQKKPRSFLRNPDYEQWGSKYAHIEIWRAHHRANPDPKTYVVHHKDDDKHNNEVCERPAPCPDWACGNLALMTRADHIREHKPGKMSGAKGFVDTKPRRRRGSLR